MAQLSVWSRCFWDRMFARLVLIVLFCSVLVFYYWAFIDAEIPLTVTMSAQGVRNLEGRVLECVRAGETVMVYRSYCLSRVTYGRIRQYLLSDDIEVSLPTLSPPVALGCHIHAIPLTIPDYTPAGDYALITFVDYQLNPFKQVQIEFPRLPLTVERRRS